MTTLLIWETFLVVNVVYHKILGYRVPLEIEPKSQSFLLVTKRSELTGFYLFIFALLIYTVGVIDVVVEGIIIGSLKVPFICCVINFMGLCLSIVCFGLLFIVLRNADSLWKQYFNSVIQLERDNIPEHTLELKLTSISVLGCVIGFKKGNLK